MKTRSQTKSILYEVNIDFDEASRAWLSNKISTGCGTYKYIKPKNTIQICENTCETTNCTVKTENTRRYNLRSRNK